MRSRSVELLFVFLCAASPVAAQPSAAQPSATPTTRAALIARLDSIARRSLDEEHLPGLSVAVLSGRDTLLLQGYGFAELGLRVPVTRATTFRLIGIGTEVVAVGLLQQVEAGRLRLEDDASALIPEFPWQGRHPTVRQLLDATSGLPDFHYLGDPLYTSRSVSKSEPEVTLLFAGRPFTHEPGERWEWTISGFHLAGGLLQRLSGSPYGEFAREHEFAPAGLHETYYCDDRSITPGLSRGYEYVAGAFRNAGYVSATTYPFDATICGTALDAVRFSRALRDGRLIRPESYRAMITAVGAALRVAPADVPTTMGLGVRVSDEGGHRWAGSRGSLMGFSSTVMDFADDSLTVAVLANASTQASERVARQLARAVLGLAPLPRTPSVADGAPLPAVVRLDAGGRSRYVGTYRVHAVNAPPAYAGFERTYRVFEQYGLLMFQPLGEPVAELFALGDDTFARGWAGGTRIRFVMEDGRAVAIRLPASSAPTAQRQEGPRVKEK